MFTRRQNSLIPNIKYSILRLDYKHGRRHYNARFYTKHWVKRGATIALSAIISANTANWMWGQLITDPALIIEAINVNFEPHLLSVSSESASLLHPQQSDQNIAKLERFQYNHLVAKNMGELTAQLYPNLMSQTVTTIRSHTRPSFSARSKTTQPTLPTQYIDRTHTTINNKLQNSWITIQVRPGDTLSNIFKRHDIDVKQAYQITRLETGKQLRRIKPGDKISMQKSMQNKLLGIEMKLGPFSHLVVRKHKQTFQATIHTRTPQVKEREIVATIWNSLSTAAKTADLSYDSVQQMISIFGWQVDFSKDIRSGDQFALIQQVLFLDGKKVLDGPIIAAELLLSNRRIRAIRHQDKQGNITYYGPNGEGIQGSFIRTPIRIGRVTSHFSRRRFNPVLKRWKAHKGIDYGAPTGTPVQSTGDGIIQFVGKKRGYGKTIIIEHAGKYRTLYAHLSQYASTIKAKKRIKQSDVIGYVGQTGWATGPHLHYEFQVNRVHKNPLTVKLPSSPDITDTYKPDFLQQSQILVSRLDQITSLPLASTKK